MKKIFLILLALVITGTEMYSQRILINQNFESGPYTPDSIPTGWAKFKINGPGVCTTPPIPDWRIRDSGNVFCASYSQPGYTSKAYNSSKSLSIPWTATTGSNTDDWIFTDSLMLIYGDSLKFRIQLGTWPDGQSSYYTDSLQVWVTTVKAPSGGIRTKIGTITSLPAAYNTWQYKTFDLYAFSYQKVYIGFRYYMDISVNGIMVNIDNVFVGNLNNVTSGEVNYTEIPPGYDLKQNYPNPFNPVTSIEFALPQKEFVMLSVYTPLGEEVAVPVNNTLEAGLHKVSFDASILASGIYFYKFSAGDFTMTRKMSLIK
jgi:hypothetical protein